MIHRIGIIGAGMIAPYHLEAIRGLARATPSLARLAPMGASRLAEMPRICGTAH